MILFCSMHFYFKVSGQVINQTSYSENGGPTTTERSTMQYSSDPTDFAEISLDSNSKLALLSVKIHVVAFIA